MGPNLQRCYQISLYRPFDLFPFALQLVRVHGFSFFYVFSMKLSHTRYSVKNTPAVF